MRIVMTQDQIQQDLNALVEAALRQSRHGYVMPSPRAHWIRNIVISAVVLSVLYVFGGCAPPHAVKAAAGHPAAVQRDQCAHEADHAPATS